MRRDICSGIVAGVFVRLANSRHLAILHWSLLNLFEKSPSRGSPPCLPSRRLTDKHSTLYYRDKISVRSSASISSKENETGKKKTLKPQRDPFQLLFVSNHRYTSPSPYDKKEVGKETSVVQRATLEAIAVLQKMTKASRY